MKKKCLSFIKVLFIFLIVFSLSVSSVSAMSYYGVMGVDWFVENVDGIDYAYTVKDGEATIIHIRTNYSGPDEITITLPTTLGGYPVTTIGTGKKTGGYIRSVFDPAKYPDGYDTRADKYFFSHIIIPEGYEYIAAGAFDYCYVELSIPKSMKEIVSNNDFCDFRIYSNIKDTIILPECKMTPDYHFYYETYIAHFYEKIVASSRFPEAALSCFYWEYGFSGFDGEMYLPANLSAKSVYDTFFVYLSEEGYNGEGGIIQTDVPAIIHCAPDCEWLSVFDTETCYGDFSYWDQIVTDVVPATSIAFDRKTVYINTGTYQDIEAKTYPSEALWTACDYVSSNPDIVKVDEYSGRITALQEGTATITATHCERGFTDSYNVVVLPEGTELPPDEPTTEEPTTEEPTTEEPTTEEPTTEEPTTEEPTTEEPTTEEPTTEEPTTEEPTTEEPTTEEPTTEEPTTEEPTTEEPTTEEP
ncbi:MAG: Ig-like domain-containing protein, partial [Clostridia bacterium]|nr:Ig-like domain-containing protein [Clostridia bacterium]